MPIPTWDAARALSALDVVEVSFDATNGNVLGFARERSIAINPVNPMPHKTRFHELAHVLLGHTSEGTLNDGDVTPRDLRECEAEAVALLCLAALDLPGIEQCRGYIQTGGARAIRYRNARHSASSRWPIRSLKAGSDEHGGAVVRAAIYARVSTVGQEPENQLQELRRYVEARGWTAVEYTDKGVSRQQGPSSRPRPDAGRCQAATVRCASCAGGSTGSGATSDIW